MRARVALLLTILGLLMSLTAAPVAAASLTVNSTNDTVADDGECTLREAIIAANTDTASGATVGECAAGSGADVIGFSVAGSILLGSDQAAISSDVSILGAGAITLSGATLHQVLIVTTGTVSLSGLTITAGATAPGGRGGGIEISGGAVTVTNSTFSNNGADLVGGGIANNGGAVSVTNSTFTNNNAGGGGGIYTVNGTLTVTNSTFSGGVAVTGGGIRSDGGTVTVTNSTFSGNTATNLGGAITNNTGAVLTVTDSTFSGNSATLTGGAIENRGTADVVSSSITTNTAGTTGGGINSIVGTTLTVTDSTISGNTAVAGGGIWNNGTLTVTSSTISGNTAGIGGGGGILTTGPNLTINSSTISGNATGGPGAGIYNSGSVLAVTNSTFSGNPAGGSIFNASGTLTVTNSTISGNQAAIFANGTETLVNSIVAGNTVENVGTIETTTSSIIGVPVGLTLADILVPGGLADNGGPTQTIALALVSGNPAIDTGNAATCAAAPVSSVDQRGYTRPTACDIGAYEAQPPTVAAHADVTAPATSAAGAVVTYTPPAGTDEQGGAVPVVCIPPSGSNFPVGSTTVTCTATDAVGHTATGTFAVIVGEFVLPDAATSQPGAGSTWIALAFGVLLIGSLGLLAVANLGVVHRRG